MDTAARARLDRWTQSLFDKAERLIDLPIPDGHGVPLPGDPVRLVFALVGGSRLPVEPSAALTALIRTERDALADGEHVLWLAVGTLTYADREAVTHVAPLVLWPVAFAPDAGVTKVIAAPDRSSVQSASADSSTRTRSRLPSAPGSSVTSSCASFATSASLKHRAQSGAAITLVTPASGANATGHRTRGATCVTASRSAYVSVPTARHRTCSPSASASRSVRISAVSAADGSPGNRLPPTSANTRRTGSPGIGTPCPSGIGRSMRRSALSNRDCVQRSRRARAAVSMDPISSRRIQGPKKRRQNCFTPRDPHLFSTHCRLHCARERRALGAVPRGLAPQPRLLRRLPGERARGGDVPAPRARGGADEVFRARLAGPARPRARDPRNKQRRTGGATRVRAKRHAWRRERDRVVPGRCGRRDPDDEPHLSRGPQPARPPRGGPGRARPHARDPAAVRSRCDGRRDRGRGDAADPARRARSRDEPDRADLPARADRARAGRARHPGRDRRRSRTRPDRARHLRARRDVLRRQQPQVAVRAEGDRLPRRARSRAAARYLAWRVARLRAGVLFFCCVCLGWFGCF